MKTFILQVSLPDSWRDQDVLIAINMGLQQYWKSQGVSICTEHVWLRKLEEPRGLVFQKHHTHHIGDEVMEYCAETEPTAMCTCGHSAARHEIRVNVGGSGRNAYGDCEVSNADGICMCLQFCTDPATVDLSYRCVTPKGGR